MTSSPFSLAFARFRRFGRRYGTPLWSILLALFAVAFFYRGRADFGHALEIISNSSPLWIALIIAIQAAALGITAWTYQIVLRYSRNHLGLGRLVDLQLERKVVGALVPAGGPASVYVFVRGVGRHGIRSEDALLTIGVRSAMGYVSFMSLLLPAVLLARPEGIYLAGATALVGSFAALAGGILLLIRYPRPARWLHRRVPDRARDMLGRARSHDIRPRALFSPYLLALAGQFANIATLALALYALGYSPSLVSILAGYTVGTAVLTLAPVFQGIGVVEVSMAVTLQQFGAPPEVAIGATLLYRIATVWLPLLVGLVAQAARRASAPAWLSSDAGALWPRSIRRGMLSGVVLISLMVMLSGSASMTTDHNDGPLPRGSRITLTAR